MKLMPLTELRNPMRPRNRGIGGVNPFRISGLHLPGIRFSFAQGARQFLTGQHAMTKKSLEPSSNFLVRIWKAMIGKLNHRIEEAYLRRHANLTAWRPAEPDLDVAPDRRPDSAPISKADVAVPRQADEDAP